MSSSSVPGPQPPPLVPDTKSRRHGRMGLTFSWENLPWWGIIILIVGIIVGFSVLTSTRYLDALYFIFDLPWNKQIVAKVESSKIAPDGSWSATVRPALEPGRYLIYPEYRDENGEFHGRGALYTIQITKDATAGAQAALSVIPSNEVQPVDTTTPTIAGIAPTGTHTVVLVEDFRNDPMRVAKRIWNANGVVLTLKVTFIAFVVAIFLGLLFGIMRVADPSPDLRMHVWRRVLFGLVLLALLWGAVPPLRNPGVIWRLGIIIEIIFFLFPAMPYTLSTLYVEIVRGVPMLVIILYMGFAITPALRNATSNTVDLRGLPAAVIGLSFGYGAYLAEVFRAGILSIPRGQMEAARSLGMTYFQAMRFIILPQAIRLILPPLGNNFIAMLKDSSLISVIALPEVLQQGRLWISRNFRAFEGYNSVMMLYLVMTLMLSLMVRQVERRSNLPGR